MLKTPYHEDTVTQSLALHLNRHHPAENRVYVFTRTEESKNGSDFVWLLFDHGLDQWFPVAVQAKRLYPSGRYEAFKKNQVDKIIRYAKKVNGIPLYLLYNYGLILNSLPVLRYLREVWPRPCHTWPVCCLDSPRDLGLIYVHADHLRNISDGRLSPGDTTNHWCPMWLPFCTCCEKSSDDPLTILWERITASVVEEDIDMPDGPRETSSILRSWMAGEDTREEALREVLGLFVSTDGQSFSPSFVLGTRIGGHDEAGKD